MSGSTRKSQFLIYQSASGAIKIDVRFEDETVWLTQQLMAELFRTTKQNIGLHLKNIFGEGELPQESVVKDFFTTAADGKDYNTRFYNLDAIISVGYRVKSRVATQFRIWATQRLREYIVKGFVLDDERLKNPDRPFDYFDELLRRIQDIRTAERQFYQKITDIYSTSIDYDPASETSTAFFKTVSPCTCRTGSPSWTVFSTSMSAASSPMPGKSRTSLLSGTRSRSTTASIFGASLITPINPTTSRKASRHCPRPGRARRRRAAQNDRRPQASFREDETMSSSYNLNVARCHSRCT